VRQGERFALPSTHSAALRNLRFFATAPYSQ